MTVIQKQAELPKSLAGKRLDAAVAKIFPEYSRARLKTWIEQGELCVNGKVVGPRYKVLGGEKVTIDATLIEIDHFAAQEMTIPYVYEDEHLFVVNKPAGLVVHPAHGNESGTLMNGLLHDFPELAKVPRAGIVHRLDKDTSGLMIIARTIEAQTALVSMMKERLIKRRYLALVNGKMAAGRKIDLAIGRHPTQRTKMAVTKVGNPKKAVTHIRVLEKFKAQTLVEAQLETGRTHQIRVHLAHQRYPIFGDPVYGGRQMMPKDSTEEELEQLRAFKRQALHAYQLDFEHPITKKPLSFEAALPEDIELILQILRNQ